MFTTSMKLSDNFRNVFWTLMFILTSVLSLYFLNKAISFMSLGTAYVIWTGIGAIGTVTVGIVLFNESTDVLRFVFMACILTGIIGLKIVS